ncbi:MAG: DUF512 domain-containing protein [Bacillota bacterium]|nr:MAG: DUF512 domain-containing protein [Bacillota bacterium]
MAVVARVRPGSIAREIGLEPGDRVYAVNRSSPRDYIDYRYLTAEGLVELGVVHPDGEEVVFEIEKDPDEDLGLEFTEDIFGGPAYIKKCANKCVFCFVDRLPPGLRGPLYLKDDDYRLSFLHGNFVTLTNLDEADIDRIAGQRLSPLYVSVHATDPELRAGLMGSQAAARILDQMARLVEAGITLHAQVVVCPGLNDGEHLERTLGELAGLRPGVSSVGVVPVGLTRFGPDPDPVRRVSEKEAAVILEALLHWHGRLGGFVYPADEFFLLTGRPLPPATFYGDFAQLGNGVGLARKFLDDLARVERALRRTMRARPAAGKTRRGWFMAVTGQMAEPLVKLAVESIGAILGRGGRAVAVPNGLFGHSVTVSGLLSGADILRRVKETMNRGTELVLVPGACLRSGSDQLIDGLTLAELGREAGIPFLEAGWLPSHMVEALSEGDPRTQATGGA